MTEIDSALLALALAWLRDARAAKRELAFANLPEALQTLSRLYGVEDLLPAQASLNAIEVRGVEKRYGAVQALSGVSLEIAQGEFFGLLGPNGAGKTTLINVIAGLARADAGAVSVMGADAVADYRRARRMLGVVPQELVFDPFFTVRETLRIQSGYFGIARQRRLDRRGDGAPRPHRQGGRQHALALRRHEAPRAGRAGAGAQAAGDRPRRAHRRRRRRAAPGPVAVRARG